MDNDERASANMRRYIDYCNENPWYERGIFCQRMFVPREQRGNLEHLIRNEDAPELCLATLASFKNQ